MLAALSALATSTPRRAAASDAEEGDRYLRPIAAVNGTFVALGAGGIVGGAFLVRTEGRARGAGAVLMTGGASQLVAGLISVARLPGERTRRRGLSLRDDPEARMRALEEAASKRDHFRLILTLEASVAAAGGIVAGIGEAVDVEVVAGVGYGLIAEGLVTLVLDGILSANHRRYVRWLRGLGARRAGTEDGGRGWVVTYGLGI